jgi:hypothetical protein
MILGANAGIADSYNRKIARYTSYGASFSPFSPYNPEDIEIALNINYLKIENQELILTPYNFLNFIGNNPNDVNYRDDGYGLGPTNHIDALNSIDYFIKRNIVFYTHADYGFVIRLREKTRFIMTVELIVNNSSNSQIDSNIYTIFNNKNFIFWETFGVDLIQDHPYNKIL